MSIVEELRNKESRDNRALLDRAADRIEELEARFKMPWEEKIYQWGYGDDKVADEALIALNNIIRGLYALDGIGGDMEGVFDFLNVSKDYQIIWNEYAKDIVLADLAMIFEVARTLLIGSKINYPFLADHLHKWGEERKRNEQSRMESGM